MSRFFLFILLFMFCSLNTTVAQQTNDVNKKRDSFYFAKTPLQLRSSILFSNKSIGLQAGLGKCLVHKELHKIKKDGKEKIIVKDRILSLDLGYYYQPGLHHNWFVTVTYHIKRTNKKGFYTEFSPLLGVSRTFISDETYTVSSDGNVTQKKLSGSWYAATGFGVGAGKTFEEKKNYLLKDVNLKLFTQIFYPEFGSVAIKPSVQIGTSFTIERIQRFSKHIIQHQYK